MSVVDYLHVENCYGCTSVMLRCVVLLHVFIAVVCFQLFLECMHSVNVCEWLRHFLYASANDVCDILLFRILGLQQ